MSILRKISLITILGMTYLEGVYAIEGLTADGGSSRSSTSSSSRSSSSEEEKPLGLVASTLMHPEAFSSLTAFSPPKGVHPSSTDFPLAVSLTIEKSNTVGSFEEGLPINHYPSSPTFSREDFFSFLQDHYNNYNGEIFLFHHPEYRNKIVDNFKRVLHSLKKGSHSSPHEHLVPQLELQIVSYFHQLYATLGNPADPLYFERLKKLDDLKEYFLHSAPGAVGEYRYLPSSVDYLNPTLGYLANHRWREAEKGLKSAMDAGIPDAFIQYAKMIIDGHIPHEKLSHFVGFQFGAEGLIPFLSTENEAWGRIPNQVGYAQGNIRIGQYLIQQLPKFRPEVQAKFLQLAIELFYQALTTYEDKRGYEEIENLRNVHLQSAHSSLTSRADTILRENFDLHAKFQARAAAFSRDLKEALDELMQLGFK